MCVSILFLDASFLSRGGLRTFLGTRAAPLEWTVDKVGCVVPDHGA
jgi:hypothetical protein